MVQVIMKGQDTSKCVREKQKEYNEIIRNISIEL